MHSDETELLASLVLLVDDGLDDVVDGAHGDDDISGILGAVVNERSVLTARDLGHLLHVLGHDVGQSVVVLVLQFAGLEVDVRVLGGTTGYRVLRIQSALTIFLQSLVVNQLAKLLHISSLNLLNFMRGAEAVEEVYERHAAFDSGEVCHRSEVHDFLDAAGGQHGEARLTAGHHVGMVAENRQSLSCQSAGRDVEHARKQFTGNLVHIGNHQQETLRGGVGGGESASLQAAVDGTGCTGFGLHLNHFDGLAKDVLLTFSGPFIDILGHRRRRSDRINGGHFTEHVGNMGRSLVTIACQKFLFCHNTYLNVYELVDCYFCCHQIRLQN